jgi:hypothetical protein
MQTRRRSSEQQRERERRARKRDVEEHTWMKWVVVKPSKKLARLTTKIPGHVPSSDAAVVKDP